MEVIHSNFFNLKQEGHIRDLVLELFNENRDDNLFSVAEYPRNGLKRVDYCILKKGKEKFEIEYTVEYKFQFSGDFKNFKKFDSDDKGFEKVFKSDFDTKKVNDKKTDCFILFVADWEDEFEKRSAMEGKFDNMKISRFQTDKNWRTKH